MPRVPMMSGPQLDPAIPAAPAPNLLNADSSAGNAIRQVGEGLQQAVAKVDEAAAKARREAEAVIGADADLELDARNEAVKSETFKLKGLSASEGRSKAIEQLGKNRQEVAAAIKSQAERERFLVRSSTAVIASRRQVETHVGREFEAARDGATKAIEDSAISKAESGGLDPAEFSLVETNAIRTIRDTQRSEAEGSQRIADFQSRVASAFTAGLLAQGRAEEAVKYVDESRATLGGRYVEAKALVERANAGAERDRMVFEGAKLVDGSAEAVRSPDGYVTEEELRRAVNLEQVDPGVRGEVEQALERRVRQEAGKLRADVGTQRDNANRADVQGAPLPGATRDFLLKYDPDFLLARDARKRAEFRSWKASKSGDARERAAEVKAQREVDQEFRYHLDHRLIDDPNAKPDEVLSEFIAEKAKQGDDVTISAVERERSGATAAKQAKAAETKEGREELAAEQRDQAALKEALEGSYKAKGKILDQRNLAVQLGNALEMRRQKVAENGGKPLSPSDLNALKADMLTKDDVVTKGVIFDSTKATRRVELVTKPPPGARTLSKRQQQAFDWATANPGPKADEVLKKLGVK